jgi:hypothetical protein
MRRALLVCGCLTLAAVWLEPLPQLGLLRDPACAPGKEA